MKIKNNIFLRKIILTLILLSGFLFRIYNLNTNPPGFFADEAAIGYNAYLISVSGYDEHGVLFPVFFKSFGEFKGAIPIYITAPFVNFNLNETNTRLPFALAGTLIIWMIFLIGKNYINERFGLAAALIASITPWLIHYSRIAFELNFYLLFFLIIIYLFSKIKIHPWLIIVTYVASGLSFYTYRASFIQIPIMIGVLSIIYRKNLLKNYKLSIVGVFLFIITSIPLIQHLLSGDGLIRFRQIAAGSKNTPLFERLSDLLDTYLYHFSPNFLFTKGDNFFVTRHMNEGLSPLLLVFIPLIVIGLISIFKNYKSKFSILCIVWLVIYPISGSLTVDPPFTSRSIIGSSLFVLISAKGLLEIIDYRKKIKIFNISKLIILYILIFLNLTYFLVSYFLIYPLISADYWGWQYGSKEIVRYFKANGNEYDELVMIAEFNEPEIFFKFYAPEGCSKCFVGTPHEKYQKTKKQLFAVTPIYIKDHPEYRFVDKHTIIYPNSQVAFKIVEIVE